VQRERRGGARGGQWLPRRDGASRAAVHGVQGLSGGQSVRERRRGLVQAGLIWVGQGDDERSWNEVLLK
jgi:hypothetical protein